MNIGILGFAHSHVDAYCIRWREGGDVRVVAGWDHDSARLAAAAGKHALVMCDSAAAGKAIILQKPMALTLAEADRIVAVVEQHRVPFTLAWQMRVDPHNLLARDLLRSGDFGQLYMVRRRHCLNTQDWGKFEETWHLKPELNRGIFADDAAHAVDFIYWLCGRPASVVAEMGTLLNPQVVNDNAIAIYRYADGSFAEVSSTFVSPATGENTLEIVAEKGVIIGNYGDSPSTSARPAGARQLKWWLKGAGRKVCDLPEITSQGHRIAGLAAPLADFLLGRRPPLATAREGRDVLRMIQACYDSAASGNRIQLW